MPREGAGFRSHGRYRGRQLSGILCRLEMGRLMKAKQRVAVGVAFAWVAVVAVLLIAVDSPRASTDVVVALAAVTVGLMLSSVFRRRRHG